MSPGRIRPSHAAAGASVLVLAGGLVAGALALPADKGYAIVGSGAFPLGVAALLATVGALLLVQALTGGLRHLDETPAPADAEPPARRLRAVAWVSAGLMADALLIEHIGFVLASMLLFSCAAHGFGRMHWGRNLAIGALLSWPIYLGFTLGLGLSLPGLHKPWI